MAGIQAKQGLGEQVRFDPITVDESGGNPIWGKFCKLYSHLILGPLFPGIKLTKKLLYKCEHLFFWKTGSFIENWPHLSLSYKHTMLERMSSKFHKIWINEDFKNPNFSELLLTTYIKKKKKIISFISQEKLGSPTRAKLRAALKNINFESIDEMGKAMF